MTTKADPKPGRWILPLVIIGMVIFTYVFVGNIADSTEPIDVGIGTETTTPASGSENGGASTTSTTADVGVVVDSESVAYLERVDTANTNLNALHERMVQTNLDFDARTIQFATARDTIRDDINPAFVAWAGEVKASVAPESNTELTALSAELSTLADAIVQASVDLLAGLQSSDNGEARASALADLAAQVEAFNSTATAASQP